MRITVIIATLGLCLAAGCERVADSRLNPLNWRPDAAAVAATPAPDAGADPRPLVERIAGLSVVAGTGGVIVRATGLPPAQGYYDGALVPVPAAAPGTLAFAFRLAPPAAPARISTPRSREVTVAVFVPDEALAGIREIRVTGARDARSVRR